MTPADGLGARAADRALPADLADTGAPEEPYRRPLWWIAAEAVSAIAICLLFLGWSSTIAVDPMVRVGQVAGMAQLQLRFAVVAIVLVVGLAAAHLRLAPRHRPLATRIACAAAAGLFTGLVAGGIDVALRGTPYGLWAGRGDYGWILRWINLDNRGFSVPHYYPPAIMWLIRASAALGEQPYQYAIKDVQLAGTALFGPAAYLAWRLVLAPPWALAIGVVAMIPLIEPVKPYPQITLVVLVPVLVRLLQTVRRASTLSTMQAGWRGAAFGVGLGLLFLLYSGWFVWCAAGFVVAFLILMPKRGAWRSLLTLTATAAIAFTAVSWQHLIGSLTETGGAADRYFYFDTNTDPAYFAMWLNDKPGDVGAWPPPGELGHVSLFPLLLVLGLGIALWLGWRRTVVVSVGLLALGAWLARMWLAGNSYDTLTVSLYPRTAAVLLYAMLILSGFTVIYVVRAPPLASANQVPLGVALIPLLFVFALTGSATINHYMPGPKGSAGDYALVAHTTRQLDGACPRFGAGRGCGSGPPASPLPPVVRPPAVPSTSTPSPGHR